MENRKNVDDVFNSILNSLNLIDFKKIANPKKHEDFKIQKKHYLIITIDEVISKATTNGYYLCRSVNGAYIFNGEFWEIIEDEKLKNFLSKASDKLGVRKYDSLYYEFKDRLLRQFFASVEYRQTEINNNSVKINLLNGTFHISENKTELKPFDHKDFLTYQLPFEYNVNSTAPLFQKYLNEVLPDENSQKILSEYLGYLFVKNLKLEKVLILYGSGQNGKSVFYEIVTALIGSQNITTYTLKSLTDDRGYQRSMINNKILNYASEIGVSMENAIFKQLASGEPVEARLPYGNPCIISNYAKLIFNCNELPKEVEHSDGYFRRFLIVPFTVKIEDSKKDVHLSKKIIQSELSGVFNWTLIGLSRLLQNKKFTYSDIVKNQLERFKTESDSVQQFLDERNMTSVIDETKHEIKSSEIYSLYSIYCKDNGFRACNLRTFKNRLESKGYHYQRKAEGMVLFYDKKIYEDEKPVSKIKNESLSIHTTKPTKPTQTNNLGLTDNDLKELNDFTNVGM